MSENSLIRIEVIDTGIGIPQDQIPYIFEEFYQVGVPTHSLREGYGLGLNIVQRIVSLLDLQLDVRSEIGKGSVFSLSLAAGNGCNSKRNIETGEAQPVPHAPLRGSTFCSSTTTRRKRCDPDAIESRGIPRISRLYYRRGGCGAPRRKPSIC